MLGPQALVSPTAVPRQDTDAFAFSLTPAADAAGDPVRRLSSTGQRSHLATDQDNQHVRRASKQAEDIEDILADALSLQRPRGASVRDLSGAMRRVPSQIMRHRVSMSGQESSTTLCSPGARRHVRSPSCKTDDELLLAQCVSQDHESEAPSSVYAAHGLIGDWKGAAFLPVHVERVRGLRDCVYAKRKVDFAGVLRRQKKDLAELGEHDGKYKELLATFESIQALRVLKLEEAFERVDEDARLRRPWFNGGSAAPEQALLSSTAAALVAAAASLLPEPPQPTPDGGCPEPPPQAEAPAPAPPAKKKKRSGARPLSVPLGAGVSCGGARSTAPFLGSAERAEESRAALRRAQMELGWLGRHAQPPPTDAPKGTPAPRLPRPPPAARAPHPPSRRVQGSRFRAGWDELLGFRV
eukprot:TRINITY_DN6186_c0_g1_i2.p1 TRINITY_DN6186_c0_g1~~TRINITY_DN6186_c0_g1_i2.p1  ORF type:complete len:421 (+),score=108.74 TRINITY_DN6186_c0_g1_i2:29-1264(+)